MKINFEGYVAYHILYPMFYLYKLAVFCLSRISLLQCYWSRKYWTLYTKKTVIAYYRAHAMIVLLYFFTQCTELCDPTVSVWTIMLITSTLYPFATTSLIFAKLHCTVYSRQLKQSKQYYCTYCRPRGLYERQLWDMISKGLYTCFIVKLNGCSNLQTADCRLADCRLLSVWSMREFLICRLPIADCVRTFSNLQTVILDCVKNV